MADDLSRFQLDAVDAMPPLSMDQLAEAQQQDDELQRLRTTPTNLVLVQRPVPLSTALLWCDVSMGVQRPYVPKPLRRRVFSLLHNLSHPGIRATARVISDRFVWPSMQRDIRD